MEALYTALAHASGGGRDGHVRTEDDRLDTATRPPKELGGSGEGLNPEQLFAAGYAACFLGAFHAAGKELESDTTDAQVSTSVSLGKRAAGGFEIAVTHDVHAPNLSEADTKAVATKAHEEICPYSHATRGNVDVTINVIP
ncbi:organic hydroperoxide resistance protein [Pseudoclavibacter alba]|uniref:organic hydroperoxide resistance protein n=1 Tax=Pseudoclavibacter albus TaxID=272241 RepID=UPI0019D05715|nr:organic hydroperoxide resistance protein [Pseudoclavibacter alba]MBN6777054.1 organic hydroperoxide resistance protein [Pseudoclavibacter alba]